MSATAPPPRHDPSRGPALGPTGSGGPDASAGSEASSGSDASHASHASLGAETTADLEAEDLEEARAGTGTRARDAWAGLDPAHRRFVVLGVVLGILGTAMVIWYALSATVDKVNWRDVAFEVPADNLVRMRFEITKPPDMTAVCTLLAQETNHGVVGRTTVTIPPASERTTYHEATIRTTSLAVIGTVRTCAAQ